MTYGLVVIVECRAANMGLTSSDWIEPDAARRLPVCRLLSFRPYMDFFLTTDYADGHRFSFLFPTHNLCFLCHLWFKIPFFSSSIDEDDRDMEAKP